jgi:endonuclease YncB( thermonuclease family)
MTGRISRRALLGVVVAGTAAAATGASLAVRGCGTRSRYVKPSDATVASYIDRDGWILTPADEKTLGGVDRPVSK